MFTPEPFQPSLYHRLQGARVFGHPLVPILGVLALAAVALLRWRAPRRVLPFVACAVLLYGLRFSLDLGRYAAAHLTEWSRDGTYATAGSASMIADAIRADAGDAAALTLVCSTGTSYLPTLLSYLLYPLPVATALDPAHPPAYAVVAERIGAAGSAGAITCDGTTLAATEMKTFADGSVLYRVPAR
jgi:hypothetical protein